MHIFSSTQYLSLVSLLPAVLHLLETSVSSTALDNLEQTLQDVGSNLELVIADRQNNLVELKKQKNNISRKVKEKREEIMFLKLSGTHKYLDTGCIFFRQLNIFL
jgi:hypothetical protein